MDTFGDVQTQKIIENGQEIFRVTFGKDNFDLPFKTIGNKKVAFLDISGQFMFIEHCADNIVKQLMDKKVEFDTILNPVSKSNALAHAIAVRWAQKVNPSLVYTVVARKITNGTGMDNSVSASYRSVTTPVEQILSLTEADATFLKGKKILVIDDVFGSGGTFTALKKLADSAGATIVAKSVVAIEEGATNTSDIVSIFILPIE